MQALELSVSVESLLHLGNAKRQLHWLPAAQSINFKLYLTVYKALQHSLHKSQANPSHPRQCVLAVA